MANTIDTRRDGTVTFLPHRLNRQPVIVRGLTASELWIAVFASGAASLLLGIVFSAVTGSVALAPTVMIAGVALGIFFGGGLLRRSKRGRPDTWLYRHLQWRICQRVPVLATYLGGLDLIARSGRWTTRRTTQT